MSGFVNLLKNLFSGLFSFIGGLLGSKKKQDAIADSSSPPRKAKNSGYFLELDEAKGIGNAGAPALAASTNGASAKPTAATAPKAASKVAPKAEPKPASANAALNLPQPTVTTFAPKYLALSGSMNGRRRPGANMSSFLDMARQIKTAN